MTEMRTALNDPAFMTQRERWLKDDCKSIMRQHALANRAHLLMNDPEIDEYGYDITLEESFSYIPIQLKTKAIASTTDSWDIRCDFFRPSFHDQMDPKFDLKIDGYCHGLHGGCGGIILQEFEEKVALTSREGVTYHYCDFLYVLSVVRGYWSSTRFSQEDARRLLSKIRDMRDNERFAIPRRAFLPIVSPAAILDWRLHIGQASNYMSIFLASHGLLSADDPILRLYQLDRSMRIPATNAGDFPSYRTEY